MKNVKRTKRAVSVIVWAAAILTLFWWTSPEQRVDRFVAKNAEVLEESLGTDLSGGYPGGLGIQCYNCWGRRQRASHRRILLRPVDSAWPPVLRLLLFA